MTDYRRDYTNGGCYFFTLNLANRKSNLLIDEVCLLRSCFRKVIKQRPFKVNAIVVLPDHIHMVITLPKYDDDYSTRIRLLKTYFAKSLPKVTKSPSQISKQEKGIWQRRFWEHKIRNEQDYLNHIHYCYINPVKHKLVKSVKDWPYSSFHRDVKLGLFPIDWASNIDHLNSKQLFGE